MIRAEKSYLRRFIRHILNLIYPRRCPVCQRILKDQGSLVCPECTKLLRPVGAHYCLKCGKPVRPEEEYCPDCKKRRRAFDAGRSVYLYDSRMRRSMVRFKYYGNREYGAFYGEAVCRYTGRDILGWKPDILVPVPLSKKSRRMRGFNQAEDIARYVGRQLEIPTAPEVLIKRRNTKSQKKLDAAGRRRNLKDAFQVSERLEGLIILLVDDVFTTGSTLDAAAECLKEAGASRVYFVTVCTVPQAGLYEGLYEP